jgi:hypothetical protein
MSTADSRSTAGSVHSNDGELDVVKKRGDIMIIAGQIGPHVNVYE